MPVDRNPAGINIANLPNQNDHWFDPVDPVAVNLHPGIVPPVRQIVGEMRMAAANPFPPVEGRWIAKPMRRTPRTGPAVTKIRTVARYVESITKDYLIAGGACLDAWRNGDLRNDIDVFVKATPDFNTFINFFEGLGWIYLKNKKLEGDYGLTGMKFPERKRPLGGMRDISAIDQYAVRNVGTVDIIAVKDLDEVIPSFDINLSKYFWSPERDDIDERFVKNPFEVSLERVSSPQNFPRHIERMQKYAKVTGFPMTCRIDNFEEAFL